MWIRTRTQNILNNKTFGKWPKLMLPFLLFQLLLFDKRVFHFFFLEKFEDGWDGFNSIFSINRFYSNAFYLKYCQFRYYWVKSRKKTPRNCFHFIITKYVVGNIDSQFKNDDDQQNKMTLDCDIGLSGGVFKIYIVVFIHSNLKRAKLRLS